MALTEKQKFLFDMVGKNTKSYLKFYKKYHDSLTRVPFLESEKLREEIEEYSKVVASCYEELRRLMKPRMLV